MKEQKINAKKLKESDRKKKKDRDGIKVFFKKKSNDYKEAML